MKNTLDADADANVTHANLIELMWDRKLAPRSLKCLCPILPACPELSFLIWFNGSEILVFHYINDSEYVLSNNLDIKAMEM